MTERDHENNGRVLRSPEASPAGDFLVRKFEEAVRDAAEALPMKERCNAPDCAEQRVSPYLCAKHYAEICPASASSAETHLLDHQNRMPPRIRDHRESFAWVTQLIHLVRESERRRASVPPSAARTAFIEAFAHFVRQDWDVSDRHRIEAARVREQHRQSCIDKFQEVKRLLDASPAPVSSNPSASLSELDEAHAFLESIGAPSDIGTSGALADFARGRRTGSAQTPCLHCITLQGEIARLRIMAGNERDLREEAERTLKDLDAAGQSFLALSESGPCAGPSRADEYGTPLNSEDFREAEERAAPNVASGLCQGCATRVNGWEVHDCNGTPRKGPLLEVTPNAAKAPKTCACCGAVEPNWSRRTTAEHVAKMGERLRTGPSEAEAAVVDIVQVRGKGQLDPHVCWEGPNPTHDALPLPFVCKGCGFRAATREALDSLTWWWASRPADAPSSGSTPCTHWESENSATCPQCRAARILSADQERARTWLTSLHPYPPMREWVDSLAALLAAVRRETVEACAKVCDEIGVRTTGTVAERCAKEIRDLLFTSAATKEKK